MVTIFYLIFFFQVGIIGFLLFYNTVSLFLFFVAAIRINRYIKRGKLNNLSTLYHHPGLPVVSFLVPAFNEENGIVASIEALMRLNYPRFEVIIINDGSTDATLQRLKEKYPFERVRDLPRHKLGTQKVVAVYEIPKEALSGKKNVLRVRLVDKVNGGKADALNAGINLAKHPYVCSVDADSLMDSNALLISMRTFLDEPEAVVGLGGQVGIANGLDIRGGEGSLGKRSEEVDRAIPSCRVRALV